MWMCGGQDPINTDVAWGNCTDFGVVDPDSNLSCGYYEVPMDYFDSSVGKARLALIKFQTTASSGKKGTLFVNPGATTGYDGRDETPYTDTL